MANAGIDSQRRAVCGGDGGGVDDCRSAVVAVDARMLRVAGMHSKPTGLIIDVTPNQKAIDETDSQQIKSYCSVTGEEKCRHCCCPGSTVRACIKHNWRANGKVFVCWKGNDLYPFPALTKTKKRVRSESVRECRGGRTQRRGLNTAVTVLYHGSARDRCCS